MMPLPSINLCIFKCGCAMWQIYVTTFISHPRMIMNLPPEPLTLTNHTYNPSVWALQLTAARFVNVLKGGQKIRSPPVETDPLSGIITVKLIRFWLRNVAVCLISVQEFVFVIFCRKFFIGLARLRRRV